MKHRCTADDLLATARARIQRLAPLEVLTARDAGALVIDTRCGDQRRETGAIPGSVHVPLSVLPWRLDPASPHRDDNLANLGRPVVLVCEHGYSSSLAAANLRDLGYAEVSDMDGGFEAWQSAGLPVEPALQ